MKAYVINLDRDKERWISCSSFLQKTPLEVTRVQGVEGKLVDRSLSPWITKKSEYVVRHNALSRAILKGQLTDGELGCSLSHLNVYNIIANDVTIEGALVLEDDMITHPDVVDVLSKALSQVPSADVISLSSSNPKSYRTAIWNKKVPIEGTDYFIKRIGMKGPLGTSLDWFFNRRRRVADAACYYITRKACLKLLDLAYPVRFDADTLLGMLAFNKLDYYMILDKENKTICHTDRNFDSAIGPHGGTRFY